MIKVGIAGFAGAGKSMVFHWFSGVKADPAQAQRGQIAIAHVPDPRLDWLSSRFHPKKTTPAAIEVLDTPGLLTAERRDNPRRLAILREAGGLLVVLNGYSGEDWADELRRFREELLFADLEIVTNRIGRLNDQMKKPKPAKEREADQEELALLERIVSALEASQSLQTLGLKPDEEKSIRSFQLLALKPEFVLVNISERLINKPLPPALLAATPSAVSIPVKLELELEELESADRETFMRELSLKEGDRAETLRALYAAMDQIVFFTIGEDECRAWGLPRGANALEGAGQIHTDFAKRFVRAEVVSYADFHRVGSMKEAKTQGVYRLEGKTYTVQDGDIMHIL
jgi:ribosome-binding ATPase YchF (GTP1/OBG family)